MKAARTSKSTGGTSLVPAILKTAFYNFTIFQLNNLRWMKWWCSAVLPIRNDRFPDRGLRRMINNEGKKICQDCNTFSLALHRNGWCGINSTIRHIPFDKNAFCEYDTMLHTYVRIYRGAVYRNTIAVYCLTAEGVSELANGVNAAKPLTKRASFPSWDL